MRNEHDTEIAAEEEREDDEIGRKDSRFGRPPSPTELSLLPQIRDEVTS
jgi:hypothetical protein